MKATFNRPYYEFPSHKYGQPLCQPWEHVWQRFHGDALLCLLCGNIKQIVLYKNPPPVPSAYVMLGVSPGCGLDEARKAYRRAAIAAHPDRGGSHERAVDVNKAWDFVKRQER